MFGTNIPDTTDHPITVQVPTSPYVCSYTTWENRNKRNSTFLFKVVSLFNCNNTDKAHFVQISVTLADSLSNCPVVQLLTDNIQNIGPLCEHRHADACSIH